MADATAIGLSFVARGTATIGRIGHTSIVPFEYHGFFAFDDVTKSLLSIDFDQDGTVYTTATAGLVYDPGLSTYFLGGNMNGGPQGLAVFGGQDPSQNDFALTFSRGLSPLTINVQSFGRPRIQYTTNIMFERIPVTTAMPEAATWSLMIGGLGLIGAILRRRRRIGLGFA